MAGIEDGMEENSLDTNKKFAQVGGSWNTAPKHPPLPGSQGNWRTPSGPRRLAAETEKGLRVLMPPKCQDEGRYFLGAFLRKPLQ